MALNALCQIIVHFESFRNIDLFHQGYYQLSAKLTYGQQEEKNISYPLYTQASRVSKDKRRKLKQGDPHHVTGARIDQKNQAFYTRGFVIRYCQEEVQINDMGGFRSQIEVKQNYQSVPYELQIELLFSDIMANQNLNIGPQSMERWQQVANNPDLMPEIKVVSKQKLKLNNLVFGMNQMCQVAFDDQHFCCTQLTIHSTLLDFRFRSIPNQQKFFQKFLQSDNNKSSKVPQKKHIKPKKLQPKTFTQFLFMEDSGRVPQQIPSTRINTLYDEYIAMLATAYERLHEKYNIFYSRCLTDKNKRECGLLPNAPVLILPGEQNLNGEACSPFNSEEKQIAFLGNNIVNNIPIQKPRAQMHQIHPKPHSPIPSNDPNNNNSACNNYNQLSGEEFKHDDDDDQQDLEERRGSQIIGLNGQQMSQMKNITSIPISLSKQLSLGSQTQLENQGVSSNVVEDVCGMGEVVKSKVAPFSKRIPDHHPNTISIELQRDMSQVAGQIFIMWHRLLELINVNPRFVMEFLEESYQDRIRMKWGEHMFRDVQITPDFVAVPNMQNVGELHKKIAKKRRTYDLGQFGISYLMPIEDVTMFPKGDSYPILFQQVYKRIEAGSHKRLGNKNIKDKTNPIQNHFQISSSDLDKWQTQKLDYKGNHLFVLVHGFQGNSHDMRLFRDNIALRHPQAMFLCSQQNQQDTQGDIQQMGVKLAKQIKDYIEEWCPANALGRISFIGHSMGGLIIRSSLKHLQDLKQKMHLYISLSTPHLGYMYNSNRIIDAGIWLLKKWRKSKCLQQLSMSDSSKYQDTFLFRLSKQPGLQWFNHVLLVSSYQDQYAPFDSARIQICTKGATDPVRGNFYMEMARNILQNLKTDILYRIDVNFQINQKNLDSFIGRTAHIMFLECQPLMKMLVFKYTEFFS